MKPVVSAVYQFPSGAYLENLAISDDETLVTRADTPELYQIKLPTKQTSAYASLIHHFPNATGLMGIAEYAPSTFAVIAGNFSMTELITVSWSVWTVRFSEGNRRPTIQEIVDLQMASFSMALAGRVYCLNAKTGDYEVVLEHESMKASGAIGLNGIRTVTIGTQTFLYYDNSKTTTVDRVAIDPVSGHAKGEYTKMARGFYADDLTYDYETGNIWVAGNANNTIFRINPDDEEIVVADALSTPSVLAPSSLVFGKGKHSRTLFGTTYAGVAPNGTITGGNLLKIEVGEKSS
ncbi:hypothetical protein N7508_003465 [Penicillium antarcticum]|uniref:uncharacterized protein n=1 Tax=Penicillium antarcticum TaxID=416450 RepID=UPI0023A295FD|nr:uncharacterized protein N7508_003465 [Penicillium antarcticum]KAJ5312635.1 hypothetical protein N7508_003465 [Penicillium antarcticum]